MATENAILENNRSEHFWHTILIQKQGIANNDYDKLDRQCINNIIILQCVKIFNDII